MPEISVIMGVYNGERFLAEAIESILFQTFRDFEFIIINDCSTDKSEKIISSFDDPRIKLINLKENKGLSFALNTGILKSKGHYIARMDSDDVSIPERFEKQVEFFKKNPEVSVLGSAYYEINGNGGIIGKKIFPTGNSKLKRMLIRINPFFHPSVMMKKDVLLKTGGYDSSMRMLEDYDLWFRVSRNFVMNNISEPLMKRRYHSGNITLVTDDAQLIAGLKLRSKYIKKGYYHLYCYIYLIKPFLAYKTPSAVRKFIRKFFLKSRLYG